MKIEVKRLYLALALFVTLSVLPSCDKDDDDEVKPNNEVIGKEDGDSSSEDGCVVPTVSEAVDLGLPSGTLWAPYNVGASSPGKAGAYFGWGEVQASKDVHGWDSYYWMADGKSDWTNITKYQFQDNQTSADWYDTTGNFIGDGKKTLEPSDDAASVNWGGKWRMPTRAEIKELSSNCTWTWKEENEYAEGSLAGYLVTGPNGKFIFLPAAGDLFDYSLHFGLLGYYWSSELGSGHSSNACGLNFNSDSRDVNFDCYRYYCFSVRAVLSAAE